jgi:hypothetical protein
VPAFPGPVELEALAMPADHGLGLHDEEGVLPVWPQTAELDPKRRNINNCAIDGVLRRHKLAV